jgi:hypothetical protein
VSTGATANDGPKAGAVPPVAMPTPRPTNGLATTALICGILWPFCITAVLAIVFGHRALVQIARAGGAQRGRGQALAGLWLAYLGLGSLVASVVVTGVRT